MGRDPGADFTSDYIRNNVSIKCFMVDYRPSKSSINQFNRNTVPRFGRESRAEGELRLASDDRVEPPRAGRLAAAARGELAGADHEDRVPPGQCLASNKLAGLRLHLPRPRRPHRPPMPGVPTATNRDRPRRHPARTRHGSHSARRRHGPHPLRAVAHRLPAHRWRPHRALLVGLRPALRRHLLFAHRNSPITSTQYFVGCISSAVDGLQLIAG